MRYEQRYLRPTRKLKIELIPKQAFCQNLRHGLVRFYWKDIMRVVHKRSNYLCATCGASGLNQGYRHPVEAHERWSFTEEDGKFVQTLVGIDALCPRCHLATHMGFAIHRNKQDEAVAHYIKVNHISRSAAKSDISLAFKQWHAHKDQKWTYDAAQGEKYLQDNGFVVD